jgi:hypothetical protein
MYIKRPQNAQTAIKYSKWLPNIPNIYQYFPFQGRQKYTQISIFGLKIYHLATLMGSARIQSKIQLFSLSRSRFSG